MLLRGVPARRSFTTKLLILSLIFVSFVFYFKFSGSNSIDSNGILNEIQYNNRKVFAGKLVNEFNGRTVNNDRNDVNSNLGLLNSNPKATEYEEQIQNDLVKQIKGLGNDGKAASLTDSAAKEMGEHQLAKIALNEELSEHLSYNRTLSDARNPLCRKQSYDLNNLPTTSVIIIFYNEPYSVLVRTVHSVLNTCDPRILKEIILVDDSSSNSELNGKLDYYVATRLPKNIVKVIRLKHR